MFLFARTFRWILQFETSRRLHAAMEELGGRSGRFELLCRCIPDANLLVLSTWEWLRPRGNGMIITNVTSTVPKKAVAEVSE